MHTFVRPREETVFPPALHEVLYTVVTIHDPYLFLDPKEQQEQKEERLLSCSLTSKKGKIAYDHSKQKKPHS